MTAAITIVTTDPLEHAVDLARPGRASIAIVTSSPFSSSAAEPEGQHGERQREAGERRPDQRR